MIFHLLGFLNYELGGHLPARKLFLILLFQKNCIYQGDLPC